MGAMDVGDLRREEIDGMGWSGSPSHLDSMRRLLDRCDRAEAEYLVVRDESGEPVCKGAIVFDDVPGAGTIMQVATRPELEGRGLATALIAEAERRIASRGVPRAHLAVEPDNVRARRLYEHLGYVAFGEREVGWESELPDGTIGWYSTTVVDMDKQL
jgi:ribosomal protein S18 acetylase RimI-like enzyme